LARRRKSLRSARLSSSRFPGTWSRWRSSKRVI
jgi:hypothetical protein